MIGWVLDESRCLKRETIPRMGRRLHGWDYKRPKELGELRIVREFGKIVPNKMG